MLFFTIFRESSDPQERKRGLTRQQRQVSHFAETWPDGPHRIYEPHAQVIESASQGSRREWELAVDHGIELFHQGIINGFLFPEVDRESRNPLKSIPILNRVLNAGIPVFFAEERLRLDPNDPSSVNKYSEAVSKSVAYVDVMSQKTRAGRFDRANEDHKLPSNNRMFGFDIVDGKRVVNQPQASALRQAGEIILREGRASLAAKWLNEQGWHTINGNFFKVVTLSGRTGLFRNPALIGETTIKFREKQVIIKHEAILDCGKFEAIKSVLDSRKLRAPRSDIFYALTGLIVCGCGAKWEANKGGKNRYYRCSAHCGEPWKRLERMHREVWYSFGQFLRDRKTRADYLELSRQSIAKLKEDLARVERDINTNSLEWKTLLEKDLKDYPAEVVNEKKAELNAARESLQWRKAEVEGQLLLLPQVDPGEVERQLELLEQPWLMCDWSTPAETPHEDLPLEQAKLMRQTLLQLGAMVRIQSGEMRIVGRLPLATGANEGTKIAASK